MSRFSASELRAILKACRDNHVQKFNYRGLEVEFLTPTETQAGDGDGELVVQVPRLSSAKQLKIDDLLDSINANGLAETANQMTDAQLDQLCVEDPVLFDKLNAARDDDTDVPLGHLG